MTRSSLDVPYPVFGGIGDADGDPIDGATVTAVPQGGTPGAQQATAISGADGELGDHGRYRLGLEPGTYRITYAEDGFTGATYPGGGEGAVDVVVQVDGTVLAGSTPAPRGELDHVTLVRSLLPAPTVVDAPTLTGKVAVGRTVKTTLGTWSVDITDVPEPGDWRDHVHVDWLLDGKPADGWSTGYPAQTFKVPASAGGKVLSYRVTVEDAASLRETATFTSTGYAVPKAPSSAKATYGEAKLRVTVTVPGVSRPSGTITVLEGKKTVGSATLRSSAKGAAVMSLRLGPGRHNLTVVYGGTPSVAGARTRLTVRL
jgi:hypothetical protein